MSLFPRVWLFVIPLSLASVGMSTRPEGSPPQQQDVARGKYLVEEVAKCTECHTPRDENGQLERDHWLQGAPIWIEPVHKNPNWAEWAPTIAGLPSYSDEQAERVLEDGIGVGGTRIEPPMHIYHMNKADAKAIIAYLRSLPSGQ